MLTATLPKRILKQIQMTIKDDIPKPEQFVKQSHSLISQVIYHPKKVMVPFIFIRRTTSLWKGNDKYAAIAEHKWENHTLFTGGDIVTGAW